MAPVYNPAFPELSIRAKRETFVVVVVVVRNMLLLLLLTKEEVSLSSSSCSSSDDSLHKNPPRRLPHGVSILPRDDVLLWKEALLMCAVSTVDSEDRLAEVHGQEED
jgi:hypothetical protein